ncbi:beta-N-acetylhexosaminidase [Methylobacterium aquaticum]|uniref:beta-N-acetylhexosaminidase n=1 Tax=Methylobacterium aquaticum TaxID=270351 RepID=A0A0J6T7V8_9HYPH|nr:beta-N-acetylhexosaminidase [Methylobacterium aquaticum]KMO41999.1 beta-hexosaminidase [Methylobacterium aquaticum]
MTLALILGCAGPTLSPEEAAFFREVQPWGFILFKRNVETPEQVRALTTALRETVGRADAPILIDQEGGRVQRMTRPHWQTYPSSRAYFRAGGPEGGPALAHLGARLMAHDLAQVGINVDCAPVLDVPVPGAHDVIGDRAYGTDPAVVAAFGRAVAEGLMAGGVLPVMKHMPGHGRAGADSHHALPVVAAGLDDLEAHDFQPFRALADLPMAMSAHVVFRALDPENPATTSATVIREVVRGRIGFSGLLMTDDLSMNALSGTFRERAAAAFRAGCDIGLHCNGVRAEMEEVVAASPVLSGQALRRADAALARLSPAQAAFDPAEARARLDAGLAAAA